MLWYGFVSERGGFGSLARGTRTDDVGVDNASAAGVCSGDGATRTGVVGGRALVRGLGAATGDGGVVTASVCTVAGSGTARACVANRRASVCGRRTRIGDGGVGTASAARARSGAGTGAACAVLADGRAAVALGLRNAASS